MGGPGSASPSSPITSTKARGGTARTRAAAWSSPGAASTTSCGPITGPAAWPVAAPPAAAGQARAAAADPRVSRVAARARRRGRNGGEDREGRRSAGGTDLQMVDHLLHALRAAGDLFGVGAVLRRSDGAVEGHLAVARADVDADAAEVRSRDQAGLDPRGEGRVAQRLARRRTDPLIDVVRPLLHRLPEVLRVLAQLLAGLVEVALDLLVMDLELRVALVVLPHLDGGIPAAAQPRQQRRTGENGHRETKRSGCHCTLLRVASGSARPAHRLAAHGRSKNQARDTHYPPGDSSTLIRFTTEVTPRLRRAASAAAARCSALAA